MASVYCCLAKVFGFLAVSGVEVSPALAVVSGFVCRDRSTFLVFPTTGRKYHLAPLKP